MGLGLIQSLRSVKGKGAGRLYRETEGQGGELLASPRNQAVSSPSLGAFKHLMRIWQLFSCLSQDLVLLTRRSWFPPSLYHHPSGPSLGGIERGLLYCSAWPLSPENPRSRPSRSLVKERLVLPEMPHPRCPRGSGTGSGDALLHPGVWTGLRMLPPLPGLAGLGPLGGHRPGSRLPPGPAPRVAIPLAISQLAAPITAACGAAHSACLSVYHFFQTVPRTRLKNPLLLL